VIAGFFVARQYLLQFATFILSQKSSSEWMAFKKIRRTPMAFKQSCHKVWV